MDLFTVKIYSNLTSFPYSKLFYALKSTADKIYELKSSEPDWKTLIQNVFGNYIDISLRGINVHLISNDDIRGLRGAYHKGAKYEEESIFLNSEWINQAEIEELKEVLFEEIGHAIDQRINGNHDTYGDEGAIFSALIHGFDIPEKELRDNDQVFIFVGGELIEVEASTPSNPLVDNDNNGLVDGVGTYQLFNNGEAIHLHRGDAKPISDNSSGKWDATKAIKTNEGYDILLTGTNNRSKQYIVWSADSSGVITSSTGWRVGNWMTENNYESKFEVDFAAMQVGGGDLDNDGLIDWEYNYRLANAGSFVDLHQANGKPISATTTNSWDVTNASKDGEEFKVLLKGTNTNLGKYIVWTTDSNGLKKNSTGWKTGNWMTLNGYDTVFETSFSHTVNGANDADNDGLADETENYQLFNAGSSVYLHRSNGIPISESTSPEWNVTKAVQVNDGFKVLLSGKEGYQGRYIVWTTDLDGLVISSSNWKVENWLSLNGYETLFGLNFSQSTEVVELSKLDGEVEGDRFGSSVSLSHDGSRLAVGSTFFNGKAGNVQAYSWNNSQSNWEPLGAAIAGQGANDMTGYSIKFSADGNRLAVGSPYTGTSKGQRAGKVQVYDWDGSSWSQAGNAIGGERKQDYFGYSVDLSSTGTILAAGAKMNDNSNGYNSGHVRVFSWNSSTSTWNQIGQDIDGEDGSDYSGTALKLSSDGSRIAIGAFHNDGGGPGQARGHVRVYDYDGSRWNQIGSDINGEGIYDMSGSYIDLSSDGTRLAIGAIINDGVNGEDSGHIRVYELDASSNWIQLGGDIDGESEDDNFGRSPKFFENGNKLIIGARSNDGGGMDSGHARIYEWKEGSSQWIQSGDDIDGDASGDSLGSSIAVSSDGTRISIGAPGNSSGHVKTYKSIPGNSSDDTVDEDGNGLVDGTNNYQIYNSGVAVHLHRDNGTALSDTSSSRWNATNAAKVGSEYKVLLTGIEEQDGKYIIWTTDSKGLKTDSTGWKLGNWMKTNNYGTIFGVNFDSSQEEVNDDDNDGFVDGTTVYQLYNHESQTGVYLQTNNGNEISDSTSSKWNAIKAVKVEDGFKVLLTGLNEQENKYIVWTANSDGLKTDSTGWKLGSWMELNNYQTTFDFNFQTSVGVVEDTDNDGLADGANEYQLTSASSAVYLQDSNGNTISSSTSSNWNVTQAVESGSGFKVLLSGNAQNSGKYIIWDVDSYGVKTASTGWRVGNWMTLNGYDSIFNRSFSDPLTGVKDEDNNGLVDDLINYQLYTSGSGVYLHSDSGKPMSDETSSSWNVTNSTNIDGGFKALLTGIGSMNGKFIVWTINSSGLKIGSTGFKSGDWMTLNSYETMFDIDFNNNSIIE